MFNVIVSTGLLKTYRDDNVILSSTKNIQSFVDRLRMSAVKMFRIITDRVLHTRNTTAVSNKIRAYEMPSAHKIQ